MLKNTLILVFVGFGFCHFLDTVVTIIAYLKNRD